MPNVLAAYMQGQQAVENNKRNRLLDMQIADAPAQRERANKLADLQLQNQQQTLDAGKYELDAVRDKQAIAQGIAGAGYIIDSKSPKAEAEQRYPELVQKLQGTVDWASLTDDDVRGIASEYRNQLSAKAGIGPAAKVPQFTREDGPRGSVLQFDRVTGERKQVVGPDNSQPVTPSRGRYRALSPQEVAAAGLPQGSSAQVDNETGKIDVLSKKDVTNTLAPKDATTAKIKINQIKVARQQLANARAKFDAIKGTLEAGPGQGWVGTRAGKELDAAIDTMRGSLTAITRVPGVGAMSNYETQLDQAKFPSRTEYESVQEQKLDAIDQLLSIVESGYAELLGGNQTGGATGNFGTPEQASQQKIQAPQGAIDALRADPRLAPQFRAKYGYLP